MFFDYNRQKLFKMLKKIIILSFLIFTTSCLSRVEKSGYSFDLTNYEVKKGVSTKVEILQNMGSPTLIDDIDGSESWIYLEEDIKRLLFFKPKIIKRNIMLLTFNDKNIVKTLNNYDLKSENKIKFDSNKSAVTENKKGFFADIFGNIGQIRPQ